MNYKKIKTCLNTAIEKSKIKGNARAFSYIKNYCDNNMLVIEERSFIYKYFDKYLEKKEKMQKKEGKENEVFISVQ